MTTTAATTLENQILDQLHRLDPTDEELVPWSTIRRHLTGTFWGQVEALQSLVEEGDVVTVKINGRTYVGICDEFCKAADLASTRRGQPRELLVL
ncbi:hypothetical protein GCM10027169_37250 [Gordonia jinhuaensis]|uniref:Uncharacterized protein n=1 Tax=Gordonia jinhuaensis TaxID=1517702 RepID=A0A916WR17_9ACTN|nr:hypothetical protein [Gordonia jinhuaensis]GGB26387.1 hypothetical protein GCM10011489_13180 [Gordonia jinhuaensis]